MYLNFKQPNGKNVRVKASNILAVEDGYRSALGPISKIFINHTSFDVIADPRLIMKAIGETVKPVGGEK